MTPRQVRAISQKMVKTFIAQMGALGIPTAVAFARQDDEGKLQPSCAGMTISTEGAVTLIRSAMFLVHNLAQTEGVTQGAVREALRPIETAQTTRFEDVAMFLRTPVPCPEDGERPL